MNGRKKSEPSRSQAFGTRQGQYFRSLGTAAAGITLVGYILGGVIIGYLLDAHFHTSFWTPLLLIVGAFGGFRDMLQTLNKVTRQEKAEKASERASAAEYRPAESSAAYQSVGQEAVQTELPEAARERPRPRIFAVPPPPQASFDKRHEEPSEELSSPDSGASEKQADLSQADLIEKLMSDDQTSSP